MRRILAGIASLAVTIFLVAGVPVALIALAGNPLPSWDEFTDVLSRPDYGGRFFLATVLPLIGWAAWAFFAIPFLAAIPAAFRRARWGTRAGRVPAAFRLQQAAASAVVGAVVVLLGAPAAPTHASEARASVTMVAAPDALLLGVVAADAARVANVAPATALVTEQPAFRERVIVRNDTLWDIAAAELGAGQRYPEIFDASTGIIQPGGARLTDPDLILPGWTVRIPESPEGSEPESVPPPAEEPAPIPVPAQPDELPSHTSDIGEAGTGSFVLETDSTARSGTSVATGADAAEDEDDQATIVGTVGGISGLLAAGLLAVLGMLRLNQRRRRRVGERLPLPDVDGTRLEWQLRDADDETSVTDVDRAVRALAGWARRAGAAPPALYAIRLAIEGPMLFLEDPVPLPEPFIPASDDGLVWIYPRGSADEVEGPISPYPSLMLLGQDTTGAHILIDLEHWRSLRVGGDPGAAAATMTSMTLELATTRWADDLRLTIVGGQPGLASALDPRRAHHCDSVEALLPELRARAAEIRVALRQAGFASVPEARLSDSPESWPTEIVIVHSPISDEQSQQLAHILAAGEQPGIAVISADLVSSGADLRLRDVDHAVLEPVGLELHPQHVSTEVLDILTRLFETAAKEPRAPEESEAAVHDRPAPSRTAADDTDRAERGDPSDDSDAPQGAGEPVAGTPYLRLLGPVGLDLASDDGEPRPPAPGRGVELVAFLHLHSHASTAQFAQAFWPNATPHAASMSMRKLTNHTRNWLGANDRGHYLPRYDSAEGYRLDEGIRSDWSDFQELVGEDVATTSSERLLAALRLVRGQPLTGIKQRFWAWCHLDLEEMIARISDVADELFGRAYAARDHARAQYAATVGNVVDPVNETAWRNLMLSALARGDAERFERIVGDLERYLDSFDEGYEPEPETQSLIDEGRRELIPES